MRSATIVIAAVAAAGSAATADPLASWNGRSLGLSSASTGADWAAGAARAGFDVDLEDFEDETAGVGFGPRAFDFGTGSARLTVIGAGGAHVGVVDGPTATAQTPLSGSRFLYLGTPSTAAGRDALTYTLDFTDDDIAGFSFRFADLEIADLVVELDDGRTYELDGEGRYTSDDDAQAGWFGFLQEPGSSGAISSVTFSFTRMDDAAAFDDFRIARAGVATPLPGAAGIGLAGFAAIGLRRRRDTRG